MTKDELQANGVKLLVDNKRLIVSYATGTGKSRIAIEFVKKVQPKRVLLVVAETLHKENWREEFKKWKGLRFFRNITVECYASLHKYRDTEWDFLILDESHHIGTDMKLDVLSTIKAEYILCLSATFPKKLYFPLEQIFGSFIKTDVSLQNSIENGWLPEPKIFTIPLKLDSNVLSETIVQEWGKGKDKPCIKTTMQGAWHYRKNRKLYPNIRLEISCTPYQKYMQLCKDFEYWKKHSKIRQMQIGSQRKIFMGLMKSKYVPTIIDKIKDKRYICFCTNIEQCDELGGEYAVHSKANGSDELVTKFNKLEEDKLFLVYKGMEGINLNNIEAEVLVQLDGSPIRTVQKMGRAFRSDDPEIYILYFKNTRDEEFLKSALDGIDSQYIKELKI